MPTVAIPVVRPPAPAPDADADVVNIDNIIEHGGFAAPLAAAAVASGRWKDTRRLVSRDFYWIDTPDVDNMWTM